MRGTAHDRISGGCFSDHKLAGKIGVAEQNDNLHRPIFYRKASEEVDSPSLRVPSIWARACALASVNTYNNRYWLTEESITDAINGNYTASYTYDAVGNRTQGTEAGITTVYQYE